MNFTHLQHCLVIEYVRTLCVALGTWQPWMDKLPAAAFAEESCEAMLSRMGHRCQVHRQLNGFEATFDLLLTLPPPSRKAKSTRGSVRAGLVDVYAARLRRVLCSDGSSPFAPSPNSTTKTVTFLPLFLDNLKPGVNKKSLETRMRLHIPRYRQFIQFSYYPGRKYLQYLSGYS